MVFVDTSAIEVISIVVTSLVGMFAISMALEGFYRGALPVPFRIIAAAGGLMLIYPGVMTDIIGVLLVGVVIAVQIMKEKKTAAA